MTTRLPLVYHDSLTHALWGVLVGAFGDAEPPADILRVCSDLAARAYTGSELTLSHNPIAPVTDDDGAIIGTSTSFTLPFQLPEGTPSIVVTSTMVVAGGRVLWQEGRPKPLSRV
jgi:hypothetical protein